MSTGKLVCKIWRRSTWFDKVCNILPLQFRNCFSYWWTFCRCFLLYPSLYIIQVKWLNPCLFDPRTVFHAICSEHRNKWTNLNIIICVWIMPFVYYYLKGTISSQPEKTVHRAWNLCPTCSLRWTRWLKITGSFMQQQWQYDLIM